jgi:hypothetical protein
MLPSLDASDKIDTEITEIVRFSLRRERPQSAGLGNLASPFRTPAVLDRAEAAKLVLKPMLKPAPRALLPYFHRVLNSCKFVQNRASMFSIVCALFCTVKNRNFLVFSVLQTLSEKHPGWGLLPEVKLEVLEVVHA